MHVLLIQIMLLALAHQLCGSWLFYSQYILEVLKLDKGTWRPKLLACAFFSLVSYRESYKCILSVEPRLQSQ